MLWEFVSRSPPLRGSRGDVPRRPIRRHILSISLRRRRGTRPRPHIVSDSHTLWERAESLSAALGRPNEGTIGLHGAGGGVSAAPGTMGAAPAPLAAPSIGRAKPSAWWSREKRPARQGAKRRVGKPARESLGVPSTSPCWNLV
jgi:hypothetical protein